MDLFSSHLSISNSSPKTNNTTSTQHQQSSSNASDKLKKLQITNNKSSSYRSTSSLLNNQSTIHSNDKSNDYEEILITIRKSERGFGFELKNGILIVRVLPNSPASNSGIKVGDLILKVNGTCVRSKDANEITNMIHESNSFVSLSLQRKLQPLIEQIQHESDDKLSTLKNVTNQLNNSTSLIEQQQQQIETNNLDNLENQLISQLSESCREDNEIPEHKTFYVEEPNENITESNESINNQSNRHTDDYLEQIIPLEDESKTTHQKREIKKTLSNSNSRSYQTKSLSNIVTKPSLVHSTSDNELDQTNKRLNSTRNTLNEADLFFPYKDDLAPSTIINETTNTVNYLDDSNEKQFDLSSFTTYTQLILKPINVAIFLNYLLSTSSDSPKNLYFCLFTDDLLSSNEKKETLLRWSYEIYSTFLMPNAPLKIKTNESLVYKLDELFDKNSTEVIPQLKKLFDDIRIEVIDIVNMQLNRLREVNQLGLVNLFQGGNEFNRTNNLANFFTNYLSELNRSIDLNRISNDWNDSRLHESQTSALICSFVTYLKRYQIPIKQIAKLDCEKIPVFVNRKFKPKKQVINQRGHSLVDYLSSNTKIACNKCKLPFWGIGNQGLMCQKSKCELKFHRSCMNTHTPECLGSQKTIRTDYKEKLDSFQKILFGSSKKKEEDSSSSFFIQSFGTNDSNLSHQKREFDRQPSIVSTNFSVSSHTSSSFSADSDHHNLPVEEAIKRFESLNKFATSPTSSTTLPINQPKIRLNANGSDCDSLPVVNPMSPTGDTFSTYFTKTNQQFASINNNKNIKIKRNSNLKGKEQACKRVGSLKTDGKKIKTNVTRSKSDPHPDDIKNAFTTDLSTKSPPLTPTQSTTTTATTTTTQSTNSNRYSIDSPTPELQNESLLSQINSPNRPTSLLTKTNTSLSNNSRNSWMNDSDMEVEEELPNLSTHIEREKFDQLPRKEIKVQEVINELIHTERKHVRNLKIMKHHFYIPIKMEILLTDDERNLLFPNLDEILELHSTFNDKLKKLRRENPIVPVSQLIDILQEQFQGEIGNRFQNACATFCQNQSEAMKFLQTKTRISADKFTAFLNRSENDQICRKLHLKDFLPTEVQRLLKYRLLFQELTKNTSDDQCRKRLNECVDSSCKISLFVNQAVTECENRKRVIEIQSKLDTKEFDQYCVKSSILLPYRNLQLTSRKLIYEGELEWKLSNIKLTALLFEDILVFLEMFRTDTSNDEKKRYILRPLIYIINKTKQMFTPVIPLSCINSFRSMHDKRSFHLVAIIEDSTKLVKQSTLHSSKPIQAQMLFILIAKSGDERNKWTQHLQELTGKMMQSVGHELQSSNVQDLSKSTTNSLTNTISATNLMSNQTTNQSTIRNNSISTSALIQPTNKIDFSDLDQTNETDLINQLNKNTNDLIQLLQQRHQMLTKLIKVNNQDSNELNTDSDAPKDWVTNSINLVNTFSTNLLNSSNQNTDTNHDKSIQMLIKLEEYLNKIYSHIVLPKIDDKPNINIITSPPSVATPIATNITTSLVVQNTNNKIDLDDLKYVKKQPPIGTNLNVKESDSIADAVSSTTTSEITADLSEDEQINYCVGLDSNSSTDDLNENENDKFNDNNNDNNVSTTSLNNRRYSDSSNKTLCLLTSGVSKIYQNNSNGSVKKHLNLDADDEDDVYSKNLKQNKIITYNNDVNSDDENEDDVKDKYSKIKKNTIHLDIKPTKLTTSQSSGDLNESKTRPTVTLKYSETFDGESRKSFRSSSELFKSYESKTNQLLNTSKSPTQSKYLLNNNVNNTNNTTNRTSNNTSTINDDLNDSSADEVKDYLTLRDSFDEISHV